MKTLNNLPDLRESGFGRPPPRDGLNLLWWFAHKCVRIDYNRHMTALYNPENGIFGFHQFFNREGLLPRTHLNYYVVGNLHYNSSLPEYVLEDYTGDLDDSNSDRIIVCYDSNLNRFERIYVTQHFSRKKFDQNNTHCITIHLLKLIKRMRRQDFLRKISNESNNGFINIPQTVRTESTQSQPTQSQPTQSQRSYQPRNTNVDDFIFVVVFIIAAIAAMVFLKKWNDPKDLMHHMFYR